MVCSGVDRTGGVVRGVDDDRLGVLADALRKGVEVDLKSSMDGGTSTHFAPAPLSMNILYSGKKGANTTNSSPSHASARKAHMSAAAAPAVRYRLSPGVVRAETAVKAVRERSAHVRRTPGAEV